MSATMRVALSFVIGIALLAACSGKSERGQYATQTASVSAFGSAAPVADSAASVVAVVARARPGRGLIGETQPSPAPSNQAGATPQDVVPGSMLVRVGKASLQVESLEVGIDRVRAMARRTGAVIANTSLEGGHEQTRAASLELRIPSERFDEAVNGLSPIGTLESVNVSVQDVGEEFVDVQARMVNARRLEQRLIDLLANRTGKLTDVLRVEGELARVREEIERYEGRLRYLRTRSSVSTLTVAVHEANPIVAERPGSHPMRDAFLQARENFVSVTAGLIASLGVLIPIGVIIGAAILLARRFLATHGLRLPARTSERA
jgi:Domain of unknown function (DUF4349)